MKKLESLLFLSAMAFASTAFSQTTQTAPESLHVIFSGDHADPSIVRDGDTFYLTYSSYNKYPGLKIWKSTNLTDWTPITYALHQNVGDVWAPDFIKHEGLFYIYFPTSTGDNYVVTAKGPAGPWSEPVKLKVSGIDPGHIADPEGNRYIYLNDGKFAALSRDGLSVARDAVKKYAGWPIPSDWAIECFCLESPKLMRRGGYYYLTSAQGGTAGPATSHMAVMARAKSPEGPWEECPHNPIVHTYSHEETLWSKGHGTIFDDVEGRSYIIYHAYVKGQLAYGRHAVLERGEWTKDGWFRTLRPQGVENKIVFHANERVKPDAFTGDKLGLQWQLTGFVAPFDQYAVRDGACVIKSSKELRTLQVNPDEKDFEVSVHLTAEGSGVSAGLAMYYSDTHHVGIGVRDGMVVSTINGRIEPAETVRGAKDRYIKLRVQHQVVSMYSSTDGITWNKFGRSFELSGYQHNALGGFSYLRPAVMCRGEGEVRVQSFEFSPL